MVWDENILSLCLGEAGSYRDRTRGSSLADSLHQHFVEGAVIRAREHHDLVPAGYGPRQPQSRHDSFRTRVAERHPFHAGKLAYQFRHLPGQGRLRSDLEPSSEL